MLYFENNVEKLQCVSCEYQQTQADKNISKASRPSENVIGVFKPQ